MRYVSGCLLNTLLHEQAHSRDGGQRIEPVRWDLRPEVCSTWCDGMAPKGIYTIANLTFEYGKATYCSNIHQREYRGLQQGVQMRLCQCGGQVQQGQLTRGRESWSCKVCGRYQIFGGTDETTCLYSRNGGSGQIGQGIQPQASDSACIVNSLDSQSSDTGRFN